MGSGGAKKTNEYARQQQEAAQRIGTLGEDWAKETHGAGRGDIDWARGELKGLYSGLGAGSAGGGGGGADIPEMAWESSVEPFYRGIMQSESGIYTPAQLAAMESAGSRPITSAYEGLARNLETERAGRGLGYGGATSGLMRDKAYALGEMGKQTMADIADKVASSRMAGAEGLTPVESEKRAFQLSERDKRRARAAASAGRAAAGAEADLATKRSLINQILGLEGDKDLAYMDRSLAAVGAGTQAVNARRDETPLWQKTLASLPGAAMSAAAGAFTGGLGPIAGKVASKVIPMKTKKLWKRYPTLGE